MSILLQKLGSPRGALLGLFLTSGPARRRTANQSTARQVVKQLRMPNDTAKPGRVHALLQMHYLTSGLEMPNEVCPLSAHWSIYFCMAERNHEYALANCGANHWDRTSCQSKGV